MAKIDNSLTSPTAAVATKEDEELVVVLRYDDNLTLSRTSLLAHTELRASELGVLIYILALTHQQPEEEELSIFTVIEHFKRDKTLDILYILKSLVAKGFVNPSTELDEALHRQLWERDHRDEENAAEQQLGLH